MIVLYTSGCLRLHIIHHGPVRIHEIPHAACAFAPLPQWRQKWYTHRSSGGVPGWNWCNGHRQIKHALPSSGSASTAVCLSALDMGTPDSKRASKSTFGFRGILRATVCRCTRGGVDDVDGGEEALGVTTDGTRLCPHGVSHRSIAHGKDERFPIPFFFVFFLVSFATTRGFSQERERAALFETLAAERTNKNAAAQGHGSQTVFRSPRFWHRVCLFFFFEFAPALFNSAIRFTWCIPCERYTITIVWNSVGERVPQQFPHMQPPPKTHAYSLSFPSLPRQEKQYALRCRFASRTRAVPRCELAVPEPQCVLGVAPEAGPCAGRRRAHREPRTASLEDAAKPRHDLPEIRSRQRGARRADSVQHHNVAQRDVVRSVHGRHVSSLPVP